MSSTSYVESIPEIFNFCVEYTHKYVDFVYTGTMDNELEKQGTEIPKIRTTESILYVHGRRVIITLLIILLLIGILGVLYYNGKVVYENGI